MMNAPIESAEGTFRRRSKLAALACGLAVLVGCVVVHLHGRQAALPHAAARAVDRAASVSDLAPLGADASGTMARATNPEVQARPVAATKPATAARTALSQSTVPVVAGLSIDRLGSPREQLLLAENSPSESRLAQLDRLDDRSRARLRQLREQQTNASGEERARLDLAIARLERNEALRSRLLRPTVHVDTRPATTRAARTSASR